MRWTAPRKQEVAHLIRHGSAVPPSPHRGRHLVRCIPKAPLSGADSPYQGEMSRRDKRGRDAVSRRLTERWSQICCNLSVSAHAEPPPLKGEAFFARKNKLPKILAFFPPVCYNGTKAIHHPAGYPAVLSARRQNLPSERKNAMKKRLLSLLLILCLCAALLPASGACGG